MTEPLRVLTWLWQQPSGRTSYQPWHVRVWAAMVRRHLSLPHTLAVVTDVPGDYGDVQVIAPPRDFEDVRIPTWGERMPQCLRRLAMFRPDAAEIFGAERFVSMDLDCVISGPLDPLFDRDEDAVFYRGTTQSRPYNGSMTMLRAGCRPQVYTEFTPDRAVEAGQKYLGSDQAWVSYILGPGEAVWDARDGVHAWGSRRNVGDPRVTFFLQPEKPWDFVAMGERFVMDHYRGSHEGRCLVLGYASCVWDDLDIALSRGSFDAVIASPEAAAHWPGDILAVARDDEHAARLARLHGFSDVIWCGRSARATA